MRVDFLGTNGWFDSSAGLTVCTALAIDDAVVVLDAGTGLSRLDPAATKGREVHILLSHLHLDHVFGLHVLPAHSPKNISIYVDARLAADCERLTAPPYMRSRRRNVRIISIGSGHTSAGVFQFTALPLVHDSPVLGFRLECSDGVVAYCTDTVLCPNAISLAQHASLLICEAGCPAVQGRGYHLVAGEPALIAREAQAKTLILTHYGARKYPSLRDRSSALRDSARVFPAVLGAFDGLRMTLKSGHCQATG